MKKSVIDLTAEELEQFAAEAWNAAARKALSEGLPVTGSHNGRRLRVHPSGRIEDLGPVKSPAPDETERSNGDDETTGQINRPFVA